MFALFIDLDTELIIVWWCFFLLLSLSCMFWMISYSLYMIHIGAEHLLIAFFEHLSSSCPRPSWGSPAWCSPAWCLFVFHSGICLASVTFVCAGSRSSQSTGIATVIDTCVSRSLWIQHTWVKLIWLVESFLVTLKICIYSMKSILWNTHNVTLIRMNACIFLEIVWFVWLLLSISSIFRFRNLPFMNFTLCHIQFVKCLPFGFLAYILLFGDYFRRLSTFCGPMKEITW